MNDTQQISRFALSCIISSKMIACKTALTKARKIKTRIKKARKEFREEFNKIPAPANESPWNRNRRFREYLAANRPDIIKMEEVFDAYSTEANRWCITREQHLAHSYLKGRTYAQCERTCREDPRVDAIVGHIPKNRNTIVAHEQECALLLDLKMWLQFPNMTRTDIETKEAEIRAFRNAQAAVKRAESELSWFKSKLEKANSDEFAAHRKVVEAEGSLRAGEKELIATQLKFKALEEELEQKKATTISVA
jgi:hypothetical protein